MGYLEYSELSTEQWREIDFKIESYAKQVVEDIDLDSVAKGEIHEQEDRYEQREYIGNYQILESRIIDIIEEETGLDDGKLVEGFYETVDSALETISNLMPYEWYVYGDDGDVWVARHWDNKEDIPEEIQELVYES